jgi:hypothetical protein
VRSLPTGHQTETRIEVVAKAADLEQLQAEVVRAERQRRVATPLVPVTVADLAGALVQVAGEGRNYTEADCRRIIEEQGGRIDARHVLAPQANYQHVVVPAAVVWMAGKVDGHLEPGKRARRTTAACP